jgi:hypothetical protein
VATSNKQEGTNQAADEGTPTIITPTKRMWQMNTMMKGYQPRVQVPLQNRKKWSERTGKAKKESQLT